ncbi:MAG: ORF6N domain-containing protein, partial [Acholeplasmatales bacterium]|nr:ORF6N domain-containing protein [Acholeplasmatales bacterium]
MEKDKIIPELNNETIESMIYVIRGQKVMLDFELAKIFGYETKRFNEQVKNNINKFPEGYRFQLTKREIAEISRSKKSTAIIQTVGTKGGRTTLPYAFTEQGIYMLMTVLNPKTDIAKNNSQFLHSYFNNEVDNKWLNGANNYEIVKFESGNLSLDINVSPEENTVWLSVNDMALLFDRDSKTIYTHIKNVFEENEVDKKSNSCFLRIANSDKQVLYYSLNVVISVGYRVKSKRGTEFRIWANNILKQYLIKGYAINNKRCLEHSDILVSLSYDINEIKNKVNKHEEFINNMNKIFYDKHYLIKNGERIESDIAYQEIYKKAYESIYIIDDYINIKTLQLLKCCNKNIK